MNRDTTGDAGGSGRLTHFTPEGTAHMVDVGAKPATRRRAVAGAHIRMQAATLALVRAGTAAKGDVLGVARIAGIMAAKRTADLIPLCHPLALSRVTLDLDCTEVGPEGPRVEILAQVETTGPTGVEMEALTAASVAALTIYDMLKAAEKGMEIGALRLLSKEGGASGSWGDPGAGRSPTSAGPDPA